MEDYATLFRFEWNKFIPLESIQGFPHDFRISLFKIGFTHGYQDDVSGHFLVRKTVGGKQVLRHIGAGDWIQVHPRIRLKVRGDLSERSVVLPL